MIDWKIKPDAEAQGGSDGFWYDLTDGGYIIPDHVLLDEFQIKQLSDAIDVVKSFETMLESNDLLRDF